MKKIAIGVGLCLVGYSLIVAAASTNRETAAVVTANIPRPALTAADYDRAAAALPQNMGKLIKNAVIWPRWAKEGNRFWYQRDEAEGHSYIYVDPENGIRELLFDHAALAALLSDGTEEPVNPNQLSIRITELADDGSTIDFSWQDKNWRLVRANMSLTEKETESKVGGASPDGKYQILRRGHNLFMKGLEAETEVQLTTDGAKCHGYGEPMPTPDDILKSNGEETAADIFWAPDSSRFITYRIDCRTTGTLTMLQSTPEAAARPKAVEYPYPLTGDTDVPMAELYVVDVNDPTLRKFDLPAFPELYYGGPWLIWGEDSKAASMRLPERGYKSLKLIELDAETARHKVLIDETAEDFVDYYAHQWNPETETNEHYWMANKDGWAHLLRYDGETGETTQITGGDWRFRYIARTGKRDEPLHIVAAGKEAGRDPYLRHLYRMDRDGGNMTLLTPEPYDHGVSVSPDGRYFVDSMSLASEPTETLLRDGRTGERLMTLEIAGTDAFKAAGIPLPEPFQAKAADGVTDIYGVIYRPANFDPNGSYPVIDNVYRGPHYVMARKSFSRATKNTAIAMAQLGFIVVQIDGRGTNKRSHAFLQHAYNNLGPVGFDDHIAALKQLKKRYSYIDLDRVGIYGFSAGGYDAVRAMIEHPDFYKAAAAASGNHDHRLDKAVWNEQWMGTELGDHYNTNSNLFEVDKIKGALMLAHGEMDENVHPMATMQLVDALIKANKDFELLIVPGAGHFLDNTPYFQRRRWDFFVEELMGSTAPKGYDLIVDGPVF